MDNFTEPFTTACFFADCPACDYRFPVRVHLNDMLVAIRCPNCTGTNAQIEFDPGSDPLPAEIFEEWKPGVLSRGEKSKLTELKMRIEGQLPLV